MPWPTVPPDVDMPTPALRDPAQRAFAFRVKATGMDPHIDQTQCDFFVDGHKVALWLPHAIDAGRDVFEGVAIAELGSVGPSMVFTGTYKDQGKKSETFSPVKSVSFDSRITNVKHAAAGGGVTLKVGVELASSASGTFLVAAPYAESMPKFANHGAYVSAGGWTKVGANGTVSVNVVPNGVSAYALFLAKNVPSQITPVSGVTLYKL